MVTRDVAREGGVGHGKAGVIDEEAATVVGAADVAGVTGEQAVIDRAALNGLEAEAAAVVDFGVVVDKSAVGDVEVGHVIGEHAAAFIIGQAVPEGTVGDVNVARIEEAHRAAE